MKRVLIPTVYFSPINTIAAFRFVKMAKYLPEYGWEPIVVTPKWTEQEVRQRSWLWDPLLAGKDFCRVERAVFSTREELGFSFLSDVKAHFRGNFLEYRDGSIFDSLLEKSREICRNEKIDAVFASSRPEYIHALADHIRRDFGIPWIADNRDIIDQEKLLFRDYMRNPFSLSPLYFFLERIGVRGVVRNDTEWMRSAAVVTAVTGGQAELLRKRVHAPVHVIMNGFDPDDLRSCARTTERNERFTIVYTGSMWGSSNPRMFLEGIDLLLRRNPGLSREIEIVFYGSSSDTVVYSLKRMRHREVVVRGGFLGHEAALSRMCCADALLFIPHRGKGLIKAKIFEYLASGRPILSVPGDGDITDRIITETKSGVVASTPEEVARFVEKWYREWKEKGRIDLQQNREEVHKYTRQSQARQLAELLDGIS